MSENIEGQQMPEVGQAPRVARSASSQPLIGADQVQAHEGASSASGGVKVREKRRGGAPRARRMSLSLTRIDAWSAAKVAFMLSIAGGIIRHHLLHCGSGADHRARGDFHAAVQRGEHPRRWHPRHAWR